MCLPLDISCHAAEAAAGATGSLLDVLVEAIREAIGAQIVLAVTWWVHVPSPDVTNPAETLQRWMLPFTALVATGGILWQALLMIVTRKGEPLVNVVKGLAAVALWGAVAVAGTNLLLRFGDAYAVWVLTQGLEGNIHSLADRMAALLVPASGLSLGLVLLVGPLVTIAAFAQLVLLLFRGGAVIILTGLLQLAAAGAFTSGTSGWLRKVLSWHLALILYKPLAATIYAIAFMLVGHEDNDLHVWLIGVGMLGMTIIALPAMLRLLSWMVGGIHTGSGSLGMLAAAGGAGVHATASLRGVTDHARDMERRYGSAPSAAPGGTPGGSGAATPSPSLPAYTGPTPTGPPAAGTAGTGAAPAAGASAAGTAPAGATGTGAAAGSAATASGAAAAGTAVAGPAAVVVAGAAVAGRTAAGAARTAAEHTGSDPRDGAR